MTARRRILPDAGPLTGTAGTPSAHRLCAGCRHPWYRHCYGPAPGCTTLVPGPDLSRWGDGRTPRQPCPCPGFKESEE